MPPALSPLQSDVVLNLYDQHHGWLYSWLRKKLNCSHNAADIAHDTFIRVMTSRELASLSEPRAYLTRTASRLMVDEARRRKIEALYLQELERSHDGAEAYPAPEHIIAVTRTLQRLVTLLEELPAKPRAAFLLHQLEGYPQAQIAGHLHVSERMVRKYMVQALVQCHKALAT